MSLSREAFSSNVVALSKGMGFIETVFEKLRRHPKRIVFPDGETEIVIRAAEKFYQRDLGIPVLLGRRNIIEHIASTHGIDLDHVAIVNPATSSELPVFCKRLERIERYRKAGLKNSGEVMTRPAYFGAMMIQYGLADAMAGGVNAAGGSLLRPMLHLVKPLPFADVISACTVVELPSKQFGDDGVLFFADTGIVPDPTMEQLATIAVQTGQFSRQVFGNRPRIAMLSFSSKGSARTPSTEKVAGAVELARHIATKANADITIDGEMQADSALDPAIARLKLGTTHVGGKANVLVFPDLNSGNIAVKLVHLLAGAKTYGQILMGFTRPAADISRGCTVEDIVAIAALVGLQAIEYRKLHPPEQDQPE